MTFDPDTMIRLLNAQGVAACVDVLDGTERLRVYLLENNPEVRQAVLRVIGDKLPTEKVVFEPQKSMEQCSFCGKMQKEVLKMVCCPDAIIQGKTKKFPLYICDECIALCVELINK